MSEDIKKPLIEEEHQNKAVLKPVSFTSLFRYADRKDKLYMFFGSISALLAGASMPFFVIFFGDISTIFIDTNREHA